MDVLLSIFATYMVTLSLSNYDGPGYVFIRLREEWLPKPLQKLFQCFVCLSTFVSIPFALALSNDLGSYILHWFALAGAASAIFKLTEK